MAPTPKKAAPHGVEEDRPQNRSPLTSTTITVRSAETAAVPSMPNSESESDREGTWCPARRNTAVNSCTPHNTSTDTP